ncbi:Signal transduction histidine kinase [Roseateles sp. YR242]|uniref:hybrid sensor histidine kinase/response regulator n=1 Tax=Roseateles sp. YR242 TaxID=1855305 RepID=UPI0008AD0C5C|nr:hybrid sensor histidine kinase/response regulator [Roseateles sp. YR242]SEK83846.1 Signal transduction histidine kinase [Roseateles sp. YR242]
MTAPTSRAELLPLIGQRASAEIAALVIPPVVVAGVPSHASSTWAWAWAGAYLAAAVCLVLARRVFRRDHQSLPSAQFEALWVPRAQYAALVFGAIWGMLPWIGIGAGSFEYALFLYLVLAGTTASTVSYAAADLGVFARYLLPAWGLAALAVPLAFPAHWATVLPLSLLYPWLVWRHARTSHSFLVQQSQLKHRSEALARAHQEARDAAAAASREKSLFLATASHDLRQPLYALTLTAQAAVQRNRDATLDPLLVDISHAASHVSDLLNALLDVSALDSRDATLPLQPLALTPLLCELHERFQPEAAARGLDWRLRGPEAPAWVMADPILLRRALSNLLHNALRYTPQGGVLLAVRQRAPGWAIEVWDTGVGIEEQERQRLFAAFERADDAGQAPEGHGLGLSVVRDCVHRLGAAIEWRSKVGAGSRFRITLAAARSPSPSIARQPRTVSHLNRLRGRVLVIEDDLGVAQGLRHLMDDWGIDSRIATDAVQAYRALAEGFEPSVVMSDLRLRGDVSGYDLMLALLPRLPQAKGLVVTGELDHPDLQRADDDGYLVLRKPVAPEGLHRVLASLLGPSPLIPDRRTVGPAVPHSS